MSSVRALTVTFLLVLCASASAQQSFATASEARRIVRFFDQFEAAFSECKELSKLDLSTVADMKTHLSKLRYACDRNRASGISIPEDIPVKTFHELREGVACMQASWSTMERLIAKKLALDDVVALSDSERKQVMKTAAEQEMPATYACLPKIGRASDIGVEARRALR